MRTFFLTQTLASAAMSAIMTTVMVLLLFHRETAIDLQRGAALLDITPQTFMVGFMSVLVPTLVTRGARRKGGVDGASPVRHAPRNVLVRSVMVGIFAAIVGTLVYRVVVVAVDAAPLSLLAFVGLKAGWGALVGLLLTPPAVRVAIGDPVGK